MTGTKPIRCPSCGFTFDPQSLLAGSTPGTGPTPDLSAAYQKKVVPALPWKDQYDFAIPEIDEAHRRIFALINQIHVARKSGSREAGFFTRTMQELVKYANEHFSAEEAMFSTSEYPEVERHIGEHKRFCRSLEVFREIIQNTIFDPAPLQEFLLKWFIGHTQGTDRGYLPYVKRDEPEQPAPPKPASGARAVLARTKPFMDEPMRDPFIAKGPDGAYYLTGTSKDEGFFRRNDGIRVWRSTDLAKWEPLGIVWSFKDHVTWQKPIRDPATGLVRQAIWGPELHFIRDRWYIPYCRNHGGTGILRSATDGIDGPYEDIKPDGPLTPMVDPTLFVDEDGSVFYLDQDARLARMKDDLSGLAEEPQPLTTAAGEHLGYEGCFLFKNNGRYLLSITDSVKLAGKPTYSCFVSTAVNVRGPWSTPKLAIPNGGHASFFQDSNGQWWATMFLPWQKPALIPVAITNDGTIQLVERDVGP